MKSDLVDLQVILIHETPKAILVRRDEDSDKVWLPKSAVEFHNGDPIPGVCTLTLPESLALEKGLV